MNSLFFKEEHKNIPFDNRAYKKERNADLSLLIPRDEVTTHLQIHANKNVMRGEEEIQILEDISKDDLSVKFHQMPLYEVVAYELNENKL